MTTEQLHIYFFPLMASGHMIPLVDMARRFARHDTNVKTTIILTHLNAPQFLPTIERDRQEGLDVSIRQLTLPTAQVGLPEDFIDLGSITAPHMYMQFEEAIQLLKQPVEKLLKQDEPDCIVSDFFISFTAPLAAKLQIPNIIFHVGGFLIPTPRAPQFEQTQASHTKNHGAASDSDTFVVPGLPHVVRMNKRQVPHFLLDDDPEKPADVIMENATQAAAASYGFVFNSFKEMEPDYVEHYRTNIRSKAWHVGPVSLRGGDEDRADKARPKEEHYCLDWLSTKEPNSVVYVCFGTLALFSADQLREIAAGLESCGQDFIWVVKGGKSEEWLPEGFEERVGEKGLMIRTWAPQVSNMDLWVGF